MEKRLTLTEQERNEFLKQPLSSVLFRLSFCIDKFHCPEIEMEFGYEDYKFVITATKKEERDGN